MKKKSKILIAILLLLSTQIYSQISKVEIVATGLTCSMCSNAINKQLKKLPEVENVDIDLNTNSFTVVLKKNNKITPRILKETIQDAGFFVGSMIIYVSKNASLSNNYIFVNPERSAKYRVLDKGFVFVKEFKKYKTIYANIPSYSIDNEDDFHLISIK